MKTMKLSDIKIKESFAATTPKEEKIEKCRKYWLKNQCQDRYIVVNLKDELVDGYIQYLVLKENGIEEAKIIRTKKEKDNRQDCNDIKKTYRNQETTYVYGIHPNSNCNKEFVWRVPKEWKDFTEHVQTGDHIWCNTKFGCALVIVTKVEILSECPVDFRVKKVAKRQIRRDWRFVKLNETN